MSVKIKHAVLFLFLFFLSHLRKMFWDKPVTYVYLTARDFVTRRNV